MKRVWFNLLLFFLSAPAFSQEILRLQDAIDLMKQNNTQLKVQQQDINLSKEEFAGTQSGFLPKVAVSHTGLFTNDPLNAFGFKLQQKIVSPQDFDPTLLNNPNDISHFNTKLSVQQPIFNFDVYYARKALREKIKATEYQKAFAENMLAVEIKKAYTNLQFLYEAKKAVQQGIKAYEEVLRNTQNMEIQGYAKPTDVLMVKVGLIEVQNKEVEIDNGIANLSDYLSWLMGMDTKQIYKPAEALSKTSFTGSEYVFSESRADVLAMKGGIAAQKNMITMNKKALLPRLNAFGEYNAYDKSIVGFGSGAYMAGFSLTWDLFNGNDTYHKIKTARLNVDKAQSEMQLYIEKNNLELQKAQRDLIANRAKIDLAEAAKEQAAEALRIMGNRYNQGLEKTADLLIAQATGLEKETKYAEAVKEFNLIAIQIEFLTQQ